MKPDKKQLTKAGKKMDQIQLRLRALTHKLDAIKKDSEDEGEGKDLGDISYESIEKHVKKALEEAKEAKDKVTWEAIQEVNQGLAAIKKDMDESTKTIKAQARAQGMEIGSGGKIFKRGHKAPEFNPFGRQNLDQFLAGIKPAAGEAAGLRHKDDHAQLSRTIADMGDEDREKLAGFAKRNVPRDWPKRIPYPAIWRKSGGKELINHKGKDAEEMLDSLEKTFKTLGIEYTHGDMAEVMIDNFLVNKECRTFCFSEGLLKALQETPLDEIPNELIKLPVPVTYFDFSELDLTYEAGGQKLAWRGCFLTMMDWCLMVMTVSNVIGGETPFAFTADPYEIPEDEMFEIPGISSSGSGFADFMREKVDIFKLAISALLYVNSVNADLKEEWLAKSTAAKMKGVKGKRKRDMKRHLEMMGKVTRAGYYLYIPTIPAGEGEEAKAGRKIGVRFLCRGHWRRYWLGPRKGIQKPVMKWIAPHWKGPEAADQAHEKMFIVDKPK
jgi:hypothetical protein